MREEDTQESTDLEPDPLEGREAEEALRPPDDGAGAGGRIPPDGRRSRSRDPEANGPPPREGGRPGGSPGRRRNAERPSSDGAAVAGGAGPRQSSARGPRAIVHKVTEDEIPLELVHQDAQRVISRLERHGFEAYLVGGCVRDLLLGRVPKDFDVATAAHPRQIKRLFRNGRIIGRRFKLVHVVYNRHVIETATFRAKPDQEDEEDGDLLIREDNVFGTAAEDAARRDFTINGMFFDPTRRRILDYVGGLEDIERRVLRTIGDPRVRMFEDPVRILRAIKFATRLGFRIDDDTWEAMCEATPELPRSAPPRVLEEILRLLRSGTALGAFKKLRACGALGVLLPSVERFLGPRDDPDPEVRDRADLYWRLLEALDGEIHDRKKPSTALCIAVLFLHIVECESDPTTRTLPGPPGDPFAVAGQVLEPIAAATRLSRRDHARTRRIIANQKRFTQAKSKRARTEKFLRSEDFDESLQLFSLRCAAWGQGWDVCEGWAARRRRVRELGPDDEERPPRRRRKRRRGRRRGRSEDGSPTNDRAGPDPDSPEPDDSGSGET